MKRAGRGIPLRVSLVALMLILLTVGLAISSVAVTSALRGRLIERTDQGLMAAADSWARPRPEPGMHPGPPPTTRRPPSPYFVLLTRSDGSQLRINDTGTLEPNVSDAANLGRAPRTIGSAHSSSVQWRAVRIDNGFGSTVIAIKLTDVNDTVSRLIWLQVGIGIAVIVIVGGLAYVLVRTSLRPLRRVEDVAEKIAAGDLTHRVPGGDSSTEVGSLATSLNVMLTQIQTSFARVEASEEQARASEQTMRRFVADASHELRTPLTSIDGFAQLYRHGAVSDAGEAMARIEHEAGRMGLLVEELLTLARLDSLRPIDNSEVDLLALATDVVHGARAVAPDRDISVQMVAGPGIPVVMGDAPRLTQVLSNLVANAIRHTDSDVIVQLTTDESLASVSVIDYGPGLSETDRDRVFDRFYRGDPSRHRDGNTGGSGLGLSIVSAIVEAHHGRIDVTESPGGGATFTVSMSRVH